MGRERRLPRQPDLAALDEEYVRQKLTDLASKNAGYLDTYPHLIDATRELTRLNSPDGYLAIAHMVYGWMPTILKTIGPMQEDDGQPVCWSRSLVSLANLGRMARDAQTLVDAETLIDSVPERSPINGSWVGLSKFLHFINPDIFPIWDSRVAVHWRASATWHNSKGPYRSYVRFCHENLDAHFTNVVIEVLRDLMKPDISHIRAVELGLFVTGRSIEPPN